MIDLLVPWASDHAPVMLFGVSVGSLYVAMGVLAFYVVMLVIITSLTWVDKKPARWKLVHLLSYAALLLVFVHSLFLGTDLKDGVLRIAWIVIHIVILLAVMSRLWRARTAA